MKLTWIIIAFAIFGTLVVLSPWIAVFHSVPSSDPNNWAAFGTYVGGTLSPWIATLALIAFLRTISQQQLQIDQLRTQAVKADILRVIEKLEQDYEQPLRVHSVHVQFDSTTHTYSALDTITKVAFPGWEQAMINQDDVMELVEQKGRLPMDDQSIHTAELFSIAAGHLNQLRLFVQKHDEISGNNALSKYYHRKHKLAYSRFVERKFLKEMWKIELTDS